MTNFKSKYFKYKQKYLALKNELFGGGIITAETTFIKKFNKTSNIQNDRVLLKYI